ncbi:MAG TPA: diguanylate cyclase [Gammaproteobacteria bacterium]|nr:diguanylate cyclase [Gammaproteobacteria bacterium]
MSGSDVRLWESSGERDALLRLLLDTTIDAIVAIDDLGTVTLFNGAAERMFGYAAGDVVGHNVSMLMPEPWAGEHDDYLARYRRTGRRRIIGVGREVEGRRRDGTVFCLELAVGEGTVDGRRMFVGILRDVTRRKEQQEQMRRYQEHLEQAVAARTADLRAANRRLEHLARVDALTQVANRRAFNETLGREVRRAFRGGRPLALILCDIDFFKSFNDRYGHLAGDACLRRVAGAIRGLFTRGGDVTARFGGEEFAVILPDTDLPAAMRLAEAMRHCIGELHVPPPPAAGTSMLTVSAGVASLVPTGPRDIRRLVQSADRALYRAKDAGRDRAVAATLADAEMPDTAPAGDTRTLT